MSSKSKKDKPDEPNITQIRLEELRKELNTLILAKYEHERQIIHIQRLIVELEKITCDEHIWRFDKYNIQYCCLCYKSSIKS